VTQKALFAGNREGGRGQRRILGIRRSVLVLLAATVLIAWMSEVLVGAVEPAALAFGMNKVFIGVIVVALLGNAAEHVTAVTVARKNRMDLSLSIALGSSVQVALFVAPVLVLLSHVLGPVPMDLAFRPALVLIVFLSILIAGQIAGDGESNWLRARACWSCT
jgi:Ca2+:H+ antiporter